MSYNLTRDTAYNSVFYYLKHTEPAFLPTLQQMHSVWAVLTTGLLV